MIRRVITFAALLVLALGEGAQSQDANAPTESPPLDVRHFRYRRTLPQADGLVAVRLDAAVLAQSRGPDSRFADVRVVDGAGHQVPYLVKRIDEPLVLDVPMERVEARVRELLIEDGRSRSFYAVRLPYRELPRASLLLDTPARVFTRAVRIGIERDADRTHRDAWFQELDASPWTHTDSNTAPAPLLLRIGRPRVQRLLLVVDEGDNTPLPIARATLSLPSYEVRFYHPGRPVELVYGHHELRPPRYDLALREESVFAEAATEITLGDERPRENARDLEDPVVSSAVFWGGLFLAVLVITAVIVRLLRAPAVH